MRRYRLLFICKRREGSGGRHLHLGGTVASSGLRNSARFVNEALGRLGIDSNLVEVNDNNDIDRELAAVRPTHAMIEAFWVVPEKFDVLSKLHPDVHWIIRNHSDLPFLAHEGMAINWFAGYLRRGIEVACNSHRAERELKVVAASFGFPAAAITYLPNCYPRPGDNIAVAHPDNYLDIGCFGAVRPMKNHLMQAVAALSVARDLRRPLNFHINVARVETGGNPILSNLRNLFANAKGSKLVEHDWLSHDQFLTLLSQMHVAMQVSLSETFNIVSADAASVGVPLVTSPEVTWLEDYAHAKPNDGRSIVEALYRALEEPLLPRVARQRRDLSAYCTVSETDWNTRFAF